MVTIFDITEQDEQSIPLHFEGGRPTHYAGGKPESCLVCGNMICVECWEPVTSEQDVTDHAAMHLRGTDGLAVPREEN